MAMRKKEMLNDTLRIMEEGRYVRDGESVELKLSPRERTEAEVFLPEAVEALRAGEIAPANGTDAAGAETRCENTDSFELACRRCHELGFEFRREARPEILVLNMANPFRPGGGVRYGAAAQEEDLCRTSSLLLSLESEAARPYYAYNRERESYLGTDAVVLSPRVEVIRQRDGSLLEETVVVSVLTCAAPVFSGNWYGLGEDGYYRAFCRRIEGMLRVAASRGYRYLVLGAFGCGAFGNDPYVVSELFGEALESPAGGAPLRRRFREIDFAVLDRSPGQDNLRAFSQRFAAGAGNV